MPPKPAKRPPTIDDLIDPEPGRLSAIWAEARVPLFWMCGAFLMLGAVVFAGTSRLGEERLAVLPTAVGQLVGTLPASPVAESGRIGQDVAFLRDEARRLSTERARLELRVADLERNLDDVTGSIRRPGRDDVTGSLPAPREPPPAPPVPSRVILPAPQQAAQPPAPAVPAGPGAVTLATRSQFGIDLGNETTLTGLRGRWVRLVERHASLLGALEPVVTVRETTDGQPVIHVVAGPLADIAEAAALCARLRAAGAAACQPATYEGQRLAVR